MHDRHDHAPESTVRPDRGVPPSRRALATAFQRGLRAAGALAFLVAAACIFASAQEPGARADGAFAPTAVENKTARRASNQVRDGHYAAPKIDDALSGRLFDHYLDLLDPSRLFLLQSDVTEFEPLRLALDDALRGGDVSPAYTVFARFQERRMARLKAFADEVANGLSGLSFDGDDTLQLDREHAPWAASQAELDALWHKLFKNDVLEMRLNGRKDEQIQEVLARRAQNQLHRAEQTTAADVFQYFMNAFATLLDPHTEYFAPRDAANFDIEMKLSLEGIGALIGGDGTFARIDRVIPGGPADKSGQVRATDRIAGVGQGSDGEIVDVRGWREDEVVDLIRGPKGTTVRLELLPAGEPEDGTPALVALVREEIKLEDQAAKSRVIEVERGETKYHVGVIELPAFYQDFAAYNRNDPDYKSSTRDVARLVTELKGRDVDAIVMDLRNNGGGSLMEAQELSGLFLGEGPVVQIKGTRGRVEVLGNDQPALYDGPFAVLVNRISASASEIFAAAVQDRGRGPVLGSRTFGKGTVQGIMPLPEGELKITQAKFYRCSGGSTQHKGVLPDVAFPDIYDEREIGESALPNALPFDQIDPALPAPLAQPALEELRSAHSARAAANPDFQRAALLLAYQEEVRKDTEVSLNEARRRAHRDALQKRLDEINALVEKPGEEAAAADVEPPSTPEDEEAAAVERATRRRLNPHLDEPDAYQVEAANVVVDLLQLDQSGRVGPAWAKGSTAPAPGTARSK